MLKTIARNIFHVVATVFTFGGWLLAWGVKKQADANREHWQGVNGNDSFWGEARG